MSSTGPRSRSSRHDRRSCKRGVNHGCYISVETRDGWHFKVNLLLACNSASSMPGQQRPSTSPLWFLGPSPRSSRCLVSFSSFLRPVRLLCPRFPTPIVLFVSFLLGLMVDEAFAIRFLCDSDSHCSRVFLSLGRFFLFLFSKIISVKLSTIGFISFPTTELFVLFLEIFFFLINFNIYLFSIDLIIDFRLFCNRWPAI